ncbi:carbohydrate ABC transporter permease [Pyxidicoccus xibeiensis]|uniref:carbohydrate ABC transporter permease n=1 Tax=Pyxidicoccus xibeiensis TaxID=2906759 RepID=UPI0020A7DE28|nr:carbohydrate ABC transporter permease [Pyxidicoccus xibeiensis]MCP3141572.1 carbohydrate ABC transporter permease [Pyxidicoccus xibeiensis]
MTRTLGDRLILVLLVLAAFVWMMPMLWVLTLSLKPNEELVRSTHGIIPWPHTLEHFSTLLRVSLTPRWLLNSVVVALGMTAATLLLSSLAGYAFARIDFPGRRAVFLLVMAGLMVPEQAILVPLHAMFASWELHNTYFSLIAPRLAAPMGVFLMTQFFKAIPRELEEAAELDNAGRFKVFWAVMLPLSRPALTTLGIFTFLFAWNDFLWPVVTATQPEMYTLSVGLGSLQGNFAMSEGLGFLMASAVFASAPMLVLYVVFQRYIVQGIAMTGGK